MRGHLVIPERRRCEPDCTCHRHFIAKPCEPGCTCRKHPVDNVDNAIFRERAEILIKAGTPARDLARAAGFTFKRPGKSGEVFDSVDTSAFLRALGIRSTTSRGHYITFRKTIPRHRAMALCHALDLSYQEAGI